MCYRPLPPNWWTFAKHTGKTFNLATTSPTTLSNLFKQFKHGACTFCYARTGTGSTRPLTSTRSRYQRRVAVSNSHKVSTSVGVKELTNQPTSTGCERGVWGMRLVSKFPCCVECACTRVQGTPLNLISAETVIFMVSRRPETTRSVARWKEQVLRKLRWSCHSRYLINMGPRGTGDEVTTCRHIHSEIIYQFIFNSWNNYWTLQTLEVYYYSKCFMHSLQLISCIF